MRPITTFALAALLFALLAAGAQASGREVISDCMNHDTLTKRYSQADYRDALRKLDGDADQYSDCRSMIENAARTSGLNSGGGGGGGNSSDGSGGGGAPSGGSGSGGTGGGGGTSTPWGESSIPTAAAGTDPLSSATPAEQAAFHDIVQTGGEPVSIDGKPVHIDDASGLAGLGDLPAPLLVVIVLAILGVLGAAATLTLNRVRDLRRRRLAG